MVVMDSSVLSVRCRFSKRDTRVRVYIREEGEAKGCVQEKASSS